MQMCIQVCFLCVSLRQHLPLHLSRWGRLRTDSGADMLALSHWGMYLSTRSPDGFVSPALGDINTPLMSPFLEESGNTRAWQSVAAESVFHLCYKSPTASREHTTKTNAAPIALIMACGSSGTGSRHTRTEVLHERKLRKRQWTEVFVSLFLACGHRSVLVE